MTSNPAAPTVTEKDAVLRERDAYIKGVRDSGMIFVAQYNWPELAARHFPLPKVTRPRVATLGGFELKVLHDTLYERGNSGGEWKVAYGWAPTGERMAMWADLFANPTEEVPDDE